MTMLSPTPHRAAAPLVSLPAERTSGFHHDASTHALVPTALRDELQALAQQASGDLPVLPAVAQEALRLVKGPDVKLDAVLRVVEQDPPLAARILSVANSTFYSRGAPVVTLRQAMIRLGTHALRDVVYMAVYANTVFEAPGLVELVRECFEHSVLVARLARSIAGSVAIDPEVVFLAGLLHDVGRARCYKLLAKSPHAKGLSTEVLRAATDELHEDAGATLAVVWKLPDEVVRAIAQHHAPRQDLHARVIAAADTLARSFESPPRADADEVRVALEVLGLDPEAELPRLRKEAVRT